MSNKKTYDSDVRYGASFLSIDRNKQSQPGEIMSDKTTGEVYIKRPQDGKIISFRHKSHTLYEAIQEFNIQFQSSIGFAYPDDPGSYLLGSKFTIDEFLEAEDKKDILMDNHELKYTFDISNKTNGIYIKPITRFGDKNICGYLAGQFSEHEYINFTTVPRTFEEWLDLSNLYESSYLYTEWKHLENWEGCNGLADISIKVTGADEDGLIIEREVSFTTCINLNEYTYVRFPDEYKEDIVDIYSINVTIDKLYDPKLQYERYLASSTLTTSGIDSVVDRLMDVDNVVNLQSLDIFYFISGASQLPTNENVSITQCVDVDYLEKALVYLSTSSGARAIQSSETEPEAFPVDTLWAEEIRDIQGTDVTETQAIDTFYDLEKGLYHDTSDTVEFTDETNNAENVFIETVSGSV